MYFWCICWEEGDLCVLLSRHLEAPPKPAFLKGIFTGYRNLSLQFFSLFFEDVDTLACTVSGEKSTMIRCSSLCNNHFFFWILLRFLSITDFKQFEYDVPWCSFHCVSWAWGLWASWISGFVCFMKFGKTVAIVSSIFFLFPPCTSSRDSNYMCVCVFVHIRIYVYMCVYIYMYSCLKFSSSMMLS